jgi:hypothetical protein
LRISDCGLRIVNLKSILPFIPRSEIANPQFTTGGEGRFRTSVG